MGIKQKKKIQYLSHGKEISGGYLHEKFLAETLYHALGSDRYQYREKRHWKHFETKKAHLGLLRKAFVGGNADITITVARLALPVLLRNLFNRKKVIVVWHYYDAYDGKSKMLEKYYYAMLAISNWIPISKLAFVCVSPFWERFFSKQFFLKPVFLFPNFLNPLAYTAVGKVAKKKQIHLGQVSFKNSNEVFLLAEQLHKKGYHCYFSTNDPNKVFVHACYEVKYFAQTFDYLKEMAASEYTLAMPFIREGWNRVAHESLLVGTQVIGFDKGGLGDLLKGANAFIVGEPEQSETLTEYYRGIGKTATRNPIKETLDIILNQKTQAINYTFLKQFETEQTGNYLLPILDWCRQ